MTGQHFRTNISKSMRQAANIGFIAATMMVCTAAQADRHIRSSIENGQVKAFYDQVTYPDDDYSYSLIKAYDLPTPYRKDQPRPIRLEWTASRPQKRIVVRVAPKGNPQQPFVCDTIDGHASSHCVWNLTPGISYRYAIEGDDSQILESGSITPTGRRRMIHLESVSNMRDLGGMPTLNGRHTRYGLIYRGGRLNKTGEKEQKNTVVQTVSAEDARFMHDQLNIRAEIDVRWDRDLGYNDGIEGNDITSSPIGSDVDYYNIQLPQPERIEKYPHFGTALKTILTYIRKGQAVYVHCVAGADRTGALCALLEALAGVGQDQIMKDYELTTFSVYGWRHRDGWPWDHGRQWISSRPGKTLQEKAASIFMAEGASRQDVEEFQKLMVQ
jgi:hypothetical protein